MKIHLVDGTYELFRQHFGAPDALRARSPLTVATRGVCGGVLRLISEGATHVGVATDHVIESFRNDLYDGYKTSAGVPEELLAQFTLVEDALTALGVKVWPMVELEADDALASAAAVAADDDRVEQVVICTPDKDLAQSVVGDRVVQLDQRRKILYDAAGVREKFGVDPGSIPDYLALVGDTADGYPGLTGWGARSASSVLQVYQHLEAIPDDAARWQVKVRNAPALAATLAKGRAEVLLYRTLATLRIDRSLLGSVDELRWTGPTEAFEEMASRIDAAGILRRARELSDRAEAP
jgi:5'-3' exonuclease